MKLTPILSFAGMALAFAACSGRGGSGFGGDGGDGGGNNGDAACGFGCGDYDAGFGGDGASGGCNPNPANFDVPGNNCDDDGNGVVDDPQGACDSSLALAGPAGDFAKAIGLCKVASGGGWGLVSATYTNGYNGTTGPADPNQHGIMTKFGSKIKPRQGSAFGILSSGWAREYDQCNTPTDPFKGGCEMDSSFSTDVAPPGYPKAVGSCDPSSEIYDASGITLKIKVPANAKGFSYDFDFWSGEWPEFVCTTYNDSFVAWLGSTAWKGKTGDFNISFDGKGNPINVNNEFFQACSPKNATVGCAGLNAPPNDTCTNGNAELMGTGFYDPGSNCGASDSGGGATSWLTTQAPAAPGETITVQFIVWDTGDGVYDSSVILDNWQWAATDTTVGTTPVN